MRVGFDISQVAHRGGVATYTSELTKELIRHKEIDWVFFYSSLRKKYQGELPKVKQFKIPPTILEIIFNDLRFPIEKFIGEIDIYHSSDWMQPKTKAKKVTTIHDVIPLIYPEWSNPKIVKIHKKRLKLVEEDIDMVIAVSNSTKKDLLKISKIPEEKITVIYEGVSETYKIQTEKKVSEFKNKYKLPDKFFLAIGGIGERKNIKRIKEATQGFKLIVLGEDIPSLQVEEIPLLYSASEALIYTTLYEGFGLPILEAMACGTPVITSNVSSMPEIAGDAALFADPERIEDIKTKINLILRSEKKRVELIKKGLKQAEKFNWKKAAFETIDLYKALLKD